MSTVSETLKRPKSRWVMHLGISLVILVISVFLMIDIESDDPLNFVLLFAVCTAGIMLILAIYGLFKERGRKKRLERIRSRRLQSAES